MKALALSLNMNLHVAKQNIMSNEVNVLKATLKENEFTLIPYYLWSNRGIGKMQMWFVIKL